MWVKRAEWDNLRDHDIRNEIRLEVTEQALKSAGEMRDIYKVQLDVLKVRVRELEAGILALNAKLHNIPPVPLAPLEPVDETQLFDEDPDLVAEDRRRVLEEGSSDALLVEGV